MRQVIDPEFEFNWGPALWAAATLGLVTVVANVVLSRPQLYGHGVILAGLIASLRTGYYENSGNNAVVGVLLATVTVQPLLLFAGLFLSVDVALADAAFVAGALGMAWFIVVLMVFLPIAYISATVGDAVRKRVGGPIGYPE